MAIHPPQQAGRRHLGRLTWTFILVVTFLVVEVVGAFLTGSLALLSDAGHMLTDALGLGMALGAIWVAGRSGPRPQRTYGLYRLEILAALANAILLMGVSVYVVVEAWERLQAPPEVDSVPMLVVATLGLVVNLTGVILLREGAKESLNVQGAFFEVVADLLGSVGVVAAGLLLLLTGWPFWDPLFAAGIGLFILPRALRIGRKALRILLQTAPPDMDVQGIRDILGSIGGVLDVHDLHVWTLTSGMEVASAHIMVRTGTDSHSVLDQARHELEQRGVVHATLQVEPEDHKGCDELRW